ncbi:amino acid adenylation domain-containing protein [Microbulbifer sp. ANSA003]|uniref:amino acid adenylation domain-containing protein n=1 Tax=Microbulbifer sp. ANSA003 TaxID=3243360 RepID=UPI0040438A05
MEQQLPPFKLEKDNIETFYPLSPLQHTMISKSMQAPGQGVYHIQVGYEIKGQLDIGGFQVAWQQVIQRHDILRTCFSRFDSYKPMQLVCRQVPLPWLEVDLSGEADPQQAYQAWLQQDRQQDFDFARPSLMRLVLLTLAPGHYHFVWSHHHSISDGWSMPIVVNEVLQAYQAGLMSAPVQFGPQVSYRSMIAWLGRQDAAASEQFWREYLQGVEQASLLKDYARPAVQDKGETAHYDFYLGEQLTVQSEQFAMCCGVTTNVLYSALFGLLLSKYTNSDDLVYGSVTAGRNGDIALVENMVGPCVNTVPVRYRAQPGLSLGQWLKTCMDEQGERNRHEYLSLLKISQSISANQLSELFNCLFVFENYPKVATFDNKESQAGQGVSFAPLATEENNSLPFSFIVVPGQNTQIRISTQTAQYRKAFIKTFFDDYAQLLSRAIEMQEAPLEQLWPGHDQRLVSELVYQHGDRDNLVAAFEQWAKVTPDQLALSSDELNLSYRQLGQQSDQLAAGLISRGVRSGDRVAIALPVGHRQLVAMLAVLKAGACYVPLDIKSPAQRNRFICSDAKISCAIAEQALEWLPTGCPVLSPEDEASYHEVTLPQPGGEDAAYIIYTSGTTGKPKGVVISHCQVLRLFSASQAGFGFGSKDKWLLLHSFAFDFSVWEIWGAWMYGAQLHLAPAGTERDFQLLYDCLHREKITVLNQTPSAFYQLSQVACEQTTDLSHLHTVIFGGEALSPALLKSWVARYPLYQVQLYNMYGITEITVHATYHKLSALDIDSGDSCIGLPLADLEILLLDKQGRGVPQGCLGEIWVLGDGVSAGYYQQGELTAQKFTQLHGRAAYQSGDLAYLNHSGQLVYVGRADNQLQLRGFRVELGEIEQVLHGIDGIEQAVVATKDSGINTSLVAFVVDSLKRESKHLLGELKQHLPYYMLPGAIHSLEKLPRTVNGKADKTALLKFDADLHQGESASAQALSPIEANIAKIWQQLLQQEVSSPQANFFELGGHSLLATQFVFAYKKRFKVAIPAQAVFEHTTLAELARFVEFGNSQEAVAITKAARDQLIPLSFSQQRLWFLSQIEGAEASYNLPLVMEICGQLDRDALESSLQQLFERHEVLRSRFVSENGESGQMIRPADPLPVLFEDAQNWDEQRRQQAINLACQQAFSLADDLLIRVTLYRYSQNRHVLLIVLHHIVTDGWSNGILQRDLLALYKSCCENRPPQLPELPIQYADFAAWQQARHGDFSGQLDYWRQKLAGMARVLPLPLDGVRGENQYQGATMAAVLEPDVLAWLEKLAKTHDATLFMLLLNAFQAVLAHHSGCNDIALGTVVANRQSSELENVVGFFTNTLVVRDQVVRQKSFVDSLKQTRSTLLDAYRNQDVPFEQVVEHVCPERPEFAAPLVQVMFVLQNAQQVQFQPEQIQGLEIRPAPWEYGQSKFDLTVSLQNDDTGLQIHFEYKSDLLSETRMQRWLTTYTGLLQGIAGAPEASIDHLLDELLHSDDAGQSSELDWQRIAAMSEQELQEYIETLPEAAMLDLLEKLEE